MPTGTKLFAQAETVLRLFPLLRKSWARRGQQAEVLITGQNAKRVLFGGLNLLTGERLLLTRPRQTAKDFAQFLLLLRHQHKRGPLALLLDENGIHTCPATRSLCQKLRIRLLFLPKRSPHLNPADHLWRWTKQTFAANRQEADIDTLVRFFTNGVHQLSPQQALRLAGVLSPRFWLRRALSNLFQQGT